MNTTRASTLLLLILGAAGCGASEPPPPKKVMLDGSVTTSTDGADLALADLARKTLADSIDVPVTDIKVESIRAIEWRDGSLGCPQPGMSYAAVITPGHKILLRVGDQLHAVHEANGRAKVCRIEKKALTEVTRNLDIAWATKSIEARRDLATRLGVEESLIVVDGGMQTEWSDRSLGCPQPGVSYAPERVTGYVLKLRHGGRQFVYHTDLEQVIPCPDIAVD